MSVLLMGIDEKRLIKWYNVLIVIIVLELKHNFVVDSK